MADRAGVTPGGPVAGRLDPRFAAPRTLFFGVGAQKAATSWLDRYLRDHPQVCLPVRKEMHYWTTLRLAGAGDRRAFVAQNLRRIDRRGVWERLTLGRRRREVDRAWRLNDAMLRDRSPSHGAYADTLFQAYRGEPVAGEITPAYALLAAETFAEMAALGPDVRFIFIMRDPLGRLISNVNNHVRKETPDGEPRAGRFAARLEEVARNQSDPSFLRSRYDLTIQRLESVAPRERVCYFFYETLFEQSQMDRLADFLGIDRRAAQLERRVNVSRPVAADLDPKVFARLRDGLEPVYGFVRERFGGEVPQTWTQFAAAPAAFRTATA